MRVLERRRRRSSGLRKPRRQDLRRRDDYRCYHSIRADLLRRLGRNNEARAAYTRALEQTQPGPEQRFLQSRLADLSESAEQQSDPQGSAH